MDNVVDVPFVNNDNSVFMSGLFFETKQKNPNKPEDRNVLCSSCPKEFKSTLKSKNVIILFALLW